MAYEDTIRAIGADPEQLELAYRAAVQAGEGDAFAHAMRAAAAAAPDDLLYAAWRFRLAYAVREVRERVIAWGWAVPLAVLNGLVLWFLSGKSFDIYVGDQMVMPGVFLLAAPISALSVLVFLVGCGARRWRRAIWLVAGLAVLTGYVWFVHPRMVPRPFEEQYLQLMLIHLPLLAWTGVGLYLLWTARDAGSRFAFLIKSLEAFIAGGLFGMAAGLFTAISFGMFDAIGIDPPELVERLFIAGGGGLVPVLAVAIVYDPRLDAARQSFEEGLSRFIALLMRVLLPLTILVLVIYLGLIARNFDQAFENRDVLIIYTAMLFAVMALLVGATPVPGAEPPGGTRTWLRRGIVAAAVLAFLVGLYALAAIVYRTAEDSLTPNRLSFIGWNVVNLGILLAVMGYQVRAGEEQALPALRATFARAMIPYAVWTVLVIFALPWMFGTTPKGMADLPEYVQELVLTEPGPILLKCDDSPHVYLLQDGEKRWIKDIPTFEARGYTWDDVHFVLCPTLDKVPDGPPIPEDAGRPPAR